MTQVLKPEEVDQKKINKVIGRQVVAGVGASGLEHEMLGCGHIRVGRPDWLGRPAPMGLKPSRW